MWMTIVKNFHRIRQWCVYINSQSCNFFFFLLVFQTFFSQWNFNVIFFSLFVQQFFHCCCVVFSVIRSVAINRVWQKSSINDDTLFAVIPIILCISAFFFSWNVHLLTLSINIYVCGEQFSSWALNENKSQILMKINRSQTQMLQKRERASERAREREWKLFL